MEKAKRGILRNKIRVIGTSVLGAPIEVYEPLKQTAPYLVMAGQHGTEPETTLLLSYGLRSIDPKTLACPVILGANPDGLQRGTRGNANGVDLNRNFPTSNWKQDLVYHRWEEDE